MSKNVKIPVANVEVALQKLLRYAQKTSTAAIYASNNAIGAEVEIIAGFGCYKDVRGQTPNALTQLDSFLHTERQFPVFGYLGYDLKNEIETLHSANMDHLAFPDVYFFEPELFVRYKNFQFEVLTKNLQTLSQFTNCIKHKKNIQPKKHNIILSPRVDKSEYLITLKKIKSHIAKGDIYELNYCQEFFHNHAEIDPYTTFLNLNNAAKAPFAAFFKVDEKYALSASPERYIKRKGNTIISQPIKGTAKRGKSEAGDRFLKKSLAASLKERTENVMIVDLVRNDLGKCAKPGSVKVDELFGVYTFEHVHQMISTISAELKESVSFVDIIRNTFPMGSMTGAPKVRMMQLAEQYETTKRGLYSGTIGYVEPNGNFDFNVVIRSLLYNTANNYLSCMVGGAITAGSIPQKEYEECLVKLAGIQAILQHKKN